jgi:transcriptional regulator with XRE-family HTH domain
MADLTGAQVRMARAALGWTLSELAQRAIVGISTIQAVEAVDGPAGISGGGIAQTLEHRASARATTLEAIRKVFAEAGVTFLPDDGESGPGIRFKPKSNNTEPSAR